MMKNVMAVAAYVKKRSYRLLEDKVSHGVFRQEGFMKEWIYDSKRPIGIFFLFFDIITVIRAQSIHLANKGCGFESHMSKSIFDCKFYSLEYFGMHLMDKRLTLSKMK